MTRRSTATLATWGGVVAAALTVPVWAQDAGADGGAGGKQPDLLVETRLGVTQTLTNNARAAAGGTAQSELATQVSPGVRVVANGARVKGFFDYSLGAFYNANGTSANNIRHSLNTNGTINAWNNQAFVDVSGVISQQSVSAFGAQSVNNFSTVNQSQSSTYRLSPYIRGTLAGGIGLEARYNYQTTSSQSGTLADSTSNGWTLGLNQRGAGKIGWSAQASSQNNRYSNGRETTTDSLLGTLYYAVSPQLVLNAQWGRESNDQFSVTKKSYSNTGLGADWRPSDRTRLSAQVNNRYFGSSHSLSLDHRTGRTIWRFSDTQNVSNSPITGATATLGTLYDLLDNLFIGLEPDPIKRAVLVQAQLNSLGLPANTQVTQNFLTQSATVQRLQQLSVALQGVRGTLTLALTRSDTRRADTALTLGDDFDTNSSIRQHGWNVSYAHRLTPKTSANITLADQSTTGSSGQSNGLRSISLGLTTRFGLRTTGGLQLRHSSSDSTTNPYSETAVVGNINHRF